MFGLLKKSTSVKGRRIGLAFGPHQIAVAVMRRDGGTAALERCELLALDPASGADAAAAAIRAAGLPRMPISTVLRAEDYQLALIEAPDVPPAELRAAMRWRLKETIDFRVEDAVIDVFDVPDQNRGGHGRMMYAVAARRAAIDRHAGALAGIPGFDVVDVPELCLRNLASLLPTAAAGNFNLILAAPGAGDSGALSVTATAPGWLQYNWGSSQNPSGMATFGVFPGPASRVHQREVY